MIGKPTDKKIFWFDTETTGTDPNLNDILQLACIIDINGDVVEEKQWFMQPFNYDNISEEALEVNDLKLEVIKDYMPPQEAHKELISFLSRFVDRYAKKADKNKFQMGGYNIRFDQDFLRSFMYDPNKNNDKFSFGSFFNYWKRIDPLMTVEYLDAHDMLPFKLEKYKLGIVYEAMFDKELKGAHDAFADVRATREVDLYLRKHMVWKK